MSDSVIDQVFEQYRGKAARAKLARKCPEGVDADRLMQAYADTCRATPKLLECTAESHHRAIDVCVRLGLWPGPQGHIYVVPRRNKRARGKPLEANAQTGYKGLIAILKRQGGVTHVESVLVYDGEPFSVLRSGDRTRLRHEELLPRPSRTIIGCYARAFYVGGATQLEVMDVDQISEIRDKYASYEGKPSQVWRDHFDEMARKTVVRRLAKYVGTDELIADAFSLVDSVESRSDRARDVTPRTGDVAGLLTGAATYVEAEVETVEAEPQAVE